MFRSEMNQAPPVEGDSGGEESGALAIVWMGCLIQGSWLRSRDQNPIYNGGLRLAG